MTTMGSNAIAAVMGKGAIALLNAISSLTLLAVIPRSKVLLEFITAKAGYERWPEDVKQEFKNFQEIMLLSQYHTDRFWKKQHKEHGRGSESVSQSQNYSQG